MTTLRIIGDVHAQIETDDLFTPGKQPYQELIRDAKFSVQIGDMGDGQSYDQLKQFVDPDHQRFFPGNHDHYSCLGELSHVDIDSEGNLRERGI